MDADARDRRIQQLEQQVPELKQRLAALDPSLATSDDSPESTGTLEPNDNAEWWALERERDAKEGELESLYVQREQAVG